MEKEKQSEKNPFGTKPSIPKKPERLRKTKPTSPPKKPTSLTAKPKKPPKPHKPQGLAQIVQEQRKSNPFSKSSPAKNPFSPTKPKPRTKPPTSPKPINPPPSKFGKPPIISSTTSTTKADLPLPKPRAKQIPSPSKEPINDLPSTEKLSRASDVSLELLDVNEHSTTFEHNAERLSRTESQSLGSVHVKDAVHLWQNNQPSGIEAQQSSDSTVPEEGVKTQNTPNSEHATEKAVEDESSSQLKKSDTVADAQVDKSASHEALDNEQDDSHEITKSNNEDEEHQTQQHSITETDSTIQTQTPISEESHVSEENAGNETVESESDSREEETNNVEIGSNSDPTQDMTEDVETEAEVQNQVVEGGDTGVEDIINQTTNPFEVETEDIEVESTALEEYGKPIFQTNFEDQSNTQTTEYVNLKHEHQSNDEPIYANPTSVMQETAYENVQNLRQEDVIYGNLQTVQKHINADESVVDDVNEDDDDDGDLEAGEDDEEGLEFSEDEISYARALYDYEAEDEGELSLKKGDLIELLSSGEDDWWSGSVNGNEGWFPASFCELCGPPEFVEQEEQQEQSETDEQAKLKRQMKRGRAAQEIVDTEQDYVKNLEMMIKAYLLPMRQRVGQLFDEETVDIVFCNLEQIHQLNSKFLIALEEAGPDNVGKCFTDFAVRFQMYSLYCNNHTTAVDHLNQLMNGDLQLESFFEASRLLVECDLSLDGFLLTPIQRLCRYPLLLKELIKYTDESHSDYDNLNEALEVMKDMAATINEDKRFKEELVRLQNSFEGWKGPPLTKLCSRLIHEGTLNKISHRSQQERQFFLFDNLLIYCKKTLRGTWSVCGQIFTDHLTIIDLKDGQYVQGRNPINNAIQLYNEPKRKWYVLAASSAEDKTEWVQAFIRERKKVEDDIAKGIAMVNNRTSDGSKKVMKERLQLIKTFKNKTLRRKPRK